MDKLCKQAEEKERERILEIIENMKINASFFYENDSNAYLSTLNTVIDRIKEPIQPHQSNIVDGVDTRLNNFVELEEAYKTTKNSISNKFAGVDTRKGSNND